MDNNIENNNTMITPAWELTNTITGLERYQLIHIHDYIIDTVVGDLILKFILLMCKIYILVKYKVIHQNYE